MKRIIRKNRNDIMAGDAERGSQERLLTLMPTPKDNARTAAALAEGGIHCATCGDLSELCDAIRHGAGAALLTEEAVLGDKEDCLGHLLREEPPWSNFPLIVLAHPGRIGRALTPGQMANITLVERPVRMATLRSVVEAALRDRRRQYQIRDILEELTRARHSLEDANRDLEGKVRERTRELQETVSELEAFSYSISHDLRSPLRAMEGYAELLRDSYAERLDDEGRRLLERISRSAARLDLLVQDVLAYSRVANGQIELQAVTVEEVVREVLESYPQLKDKAAIRLEGPMPPVLGHVAYLTQCVSNLIGNAVKFVRPGVPAAVRIWAEEEEDNQRVKICFEDNGIGIASNHFEEIFQIFGRIHGKSYEGTGIGLAIVRKAVERMGGAVSLTSEVGKGSCFCLHLRRAP